MDIFQMRLFSDKCTMVTTSLFELNGESSFLHCYTCPHPHLTQSFARSRTHAHQGGLSPLLIYSWLVQPFDPLYPGLWPPIKNLRIAFKFLVFIEFPFTLMMFILLVIKIPSTYLYSIFEFSDPQSHFFNSFPLVSCPLCLLFFRSQSCFLSHGNLLLWHCSISTHPFLSLPFSPWYPTSLMWFLPQPER